MVGQIQVLIATLTGRFGDLLVDLTYNDAKKTINRKKILMNKNEEINLF